jgi:hypothetical protein
MVYLGSPNLKMLDLSMAMQQITKGYILILFGTKIGDIFEDHIPVQKNQPTSMSQIVFQLSHQRKWGFHHQQLGIIQQRLRTIHQKPWIYPSLIKHGNDKFPIYIGFCNEKL